MKAQVNFDSLGGGIVGDIFGIYQYTSATPSGNFIILANNTEYRMLSYTVTKSVENDYFSLTATSGTNSVTLTAKKACTIRTDKYGTDATEGQAVTSTDTYTLSVGETRTYTDGASYSYRKFTVVS